MQKKHKKLKLKIKNFQIKQQLWVFVSSQIENPAFDSQTKDTLTTKASKFGSRCKLSDKFLREVLASGIVSCGFS